MDYFFDIVSLVVFFFVSFRHLDKSVLFVAIFVHCLLSSSVRLRTCNGMKAVYDHKMTTEKRRRRGEKTVRYFENKIFVQFVIFTESSSFVVVFFAHVSVPQMLNLIQTLISNWNNFQYRFVNINEKETKALLSIENGSLDKMSKIDGISIF